jgi:hypothetical protein
MKFITFKGEAKKKHKMDTTLNNNEGTQHRDNQ